MEILERVLQIDLARRVLSLQEDVVSRDLEIERLREALDRCWIPPDDSLRCDGCGKTIADHDRLLRCGTLPDRGWGTTKGIEMSEDETKNMLHLLRSPWGHGEPQLRQSRHDAADEIERLRAENVTFRNAQIACEYCDPAGHAAAVAVERERCATLCESYEPIGREGPQTTAYELARTIRGLP